MKTDLSVLSANGRMLLAGLAVLIATVPAFAIPSKKPARKKPAVSAKASKATVKNAVTLQRATAAAKDVRLARTRTGRNGFVSGGPWKEPTFADSAMGDAIDGEDLTIRQAAVNALGPYNGSVVRGGSENRKNSHDRQSALGAGKRVSALFDDQIGVRAGGLHEGIVERETPMRLSRRVSIDMTKALAQSNNPYFARVGEKLGFDKVHSYAKQFGLGERAGLGIEGEFAGVLPTEPPKFGGVGMMTSFGEGIQLTALQLASLLSAIANGGTMYHLQYPRSSDGVARLHTQDQASIGYQWRNL